MAPALGNRPAPATLAAGGRPSRTAEGLFDRLARRYDLTNTALSLGLDSWWRVAAAEALPVRAGDRVIDLCAGTLELSSAIERAHPGVRIASVDRAGHMLAVGRHKLRGAAPPTVQGCALVLPFRSAIFDGATMAFGLRNLPDADAGIAEARRVLKPGARLVILEFVHPAGALARASHLFGVRFLVPVVGGLIGGDPGAYRYLARSIEAFLDLEGVARLLSAHGFRVVERRLLAPRGPAALVVAEAIS